MAEFCSNCRLFHESRSANAGLCRAHPPRAQADGSAIWPSVNRNDWCGEYRQIPPPENPGLRKMVI
ncbi:hypothetical protein [Phreatobacter stygius]|uniref:Uncharacterized protein n=1 Tax=Phreatobacter stygius TaxID=1940610 RepID=A0A4D7AY64_9HYPH|nr:hypothetical protein [Phreatobacter stygius]QCI66219.1 hypothetical protein E8M01_19575 [Phreatobacter stygius]